MRFVCNSCKSEFTTLSMNSGDKFAFSIMMIDRMRCPNCGAANKQHLAKPLKKTRSRWQPVHRSRNSEDYPLPSISLHPICQRRLMGSFSTQMFVKCEGCPSAFNCLTGNVDDGNGIIKETQEEALERQAKKVEKAKAQVAAKELKDAEDKLKADVEKFEKSGLIFYKKNNVLYAKFYGTIWKLGSLDEQAILNNSWHTPKTTVIKNSLIKRNIDLSMAGKVLKWKLLSL